MLYLNDPLDIINVILLVAASLEAAWLYKVTKRKTMVFYGVSFYLILIMKFLPQSEVFILYTILVNSMMIVMVYKTLKDKLYNLMLIIASWVLLMNMLGFGLGYTFHGENAIFIMIFGYIWYKTAPYCWNPIRCNNYKLKKIK